MLAVENDTALAALVLAESERIPVMSQSTTLELPRHDSKCPTSSLVEHVIVPRILL